MKVWSRLAVVLVAAALAQRADAIPAFARKYGVSCSACHVAWPILNQVGQNFRDNGYRFKNGKDHPEAQRPEYVPLALRTTPAYQFTRTTNQPAGLAPTDPTAPDTRYPVVTRTGSVAPSGLDILTAGTISDNLSFLVVVSGFNPASPEAELESAWARLDDLAGTGWLNLKVGKFELDSPASAHRAISLLYNYAAYSPRFNGSAINLDFQENQYGFELDGHDARSATRYSLALVSAHDDPGSSGAFSSPFLYGHVQRSLELDNPILPWARLGVLGGIGWWPTEFETLGTAAPTGTALGTSAATSSPTPIAGTGRNHKNYYRAGADLSWILGYPSTPFFFTVAYMYGRESAGLAAGTDPTGTIDLSTQDNSFHGGFAELDWAPTINFVLFARYDGVRYATAPGDVDAGTLGVRYYLALGPRASMAVHAEVHADRNRGFDPVAGGPSWNGGDVNVQSALLGLDFAY